MSEPPRRRRRFRRTWSATKVSGPYGPRFDLVSHGDAPLTERQAYLWRWIVLGVLAVGVTALILLGH